MYTKFIVLKLAIVLVLPLTLFAMPDKAKKTELPKEINAAIDQLVALPVATSTLVHDCEASGCPKDVSYPKEPTCIPFDGSFTKKDCNDNYHVLNAGIVDGIPVCPRSPGEDYKCTIKCKNEVREMGCNFVKYTPIEPIIKRKKVNGAIVEECCFQSKCEYDCATGEPCPEVASAE